MDGFTFNIGNLSDVLKRLHSLEAKVQQDVKDEINASALNIESMAKRLAPVNMNTLRGSIYKKEKDIKNGYVFTVGAKASYAAYVEFGTGGKVSIPKGFEQLAGNFKGRKGGKFEDMVEALMQWGIRKGYIQSGKGAKQHAFYMALKILKNGLKPQPFLIPAFEAEKPKLINNIKKAIENVKS